LYILAFHFSLAAAMYTLICNFRKCYDELKYLKDFFPGVPMMATTATLQPDKQDLLCQYYLRNPIVVRSTVNKPNMRLKVLPYEQLNKRNIKVRSEATSRDGKKGY